MNTILDSIYQSIIYVTSDSFFWPSMAITTMIGLFIGAVLYDGCIREIKKLIISMLAYAFMVITVTVERIVPSFFDGVFRIHNPFAGTVTVLAVTLFYLLGMVIGILITKYAHPNHVSFPKIKK